jgi:hypothetical protein
MVLLSVLVPVATDVAILATIAIVISSIGPVVDAVDVAVANVVASPLTQGE